MSLDICRPLRYHYHNTTPIYCCWESKVITSEKTGSYQYTYIPPDITIPFLCIYPKERRTYVHTQAVCEHLCSFIHKHPNLGTIQVFITWWVYKQSVVHLRHKVPLSTKKKTGLLTQQHGGIPHIYATWKKGSSIHSEGPIWLHWYEIWKTQKYREKIDQFLSGAHHRGGISLNRATREYFDVIKLCCFFNYGGFYTIVCIYQNS